MDSDFSISPSSFLPLLICGMISMVYVVHILSCAIADSNLRARLYGIFLTQVFHYFDSQDNNDDKAAVKLTVIFILCLETLQQALLVHTFWTYFINLPSQNVTRFASVNWSFLGRLVPSELAIFTVECFFVARIWILSGYHRRYLLLVIPTIIGLGFGLTTTVHLFLNPAFIDSRTSFWYIATWTAVRMSADIAVSGVTCWRLYRWRGGISSELQSVLWSIFLFSLTTGLLSCVFALLVFVTYLAGPLKLIYAGIYLIYSKIYANSLLASLNNRRALRARAHHEVDVSALDIDFKSRVTSRVLFSRHDAEKGRIPLWNSPSQSGESTTHQNLTMLTFGAGAPVSSMMGARGRRRSF